MSYLIVIQGSGDNTATFNRKDVELKFVCGSGAAASRNIVLANVHSDYLYFCDDDVDIDLGSVRELVKLAAQLDYDIFTCRIAGDDGLPRKRYPSHLASMKKWHVGRVGTPEVLLRTRQFAQRPVFFDERYGAGRKLRFGDEAIFLADCLRAGYSGVHVALIVGSTVQPSTGEERIFSTVALRVRAAFRAFGFRGLHLTLAFLVRLIMRGGIELLASRRITRSPQGRLLGPESAQE